MEFRRGFPRLRIRVSKGCHTAQLQNVSEGRPTNAAMISSLAFRVVIVKAASLRS